MPFVTGIPVRGPNFFNRESVVKRLLDAVELFQTTNTPTHHLIIGPRRIGKTSVLFFLQDKMAQLDQFVPLYLNGEVIVSLDDFYTELFRECLGQSDYADRIRWSLRKSLESIVQLSVGGVAIEFDRSSRNLKDKLVRFMESYSSRTDKKFILLLDEVSFLSNIRPKDALEIAAVLKKSNHLMVVAAVASESYARLSQRMPAISNMFNEIISIGPFDSTDTFELIRHIGSEQQVTFREDAARTIFLASGGFPYYIHRICQECTTAANVRKTTTITAKMVDDAFSRIGRDYRINEIISLPKDLRAVTHAIASRNTDVDAITRVTSLSRKRVTDSVEYLKQYGYVRDEGGVLVAYHPIIEPQLFEDVTLRSRCSFENLPGTERTRVFIGGNYDHMATIRELARFVEDMNLHPIVCYDFDVPKDKIYEYDLKLLHRCERAIFEVTAPDGHHYEIQKGLEYNVRVFVLYQVRDEKRTPPPTITSMLTSFNIQGVKPKSFGYMNFQEAKRQVVRWLS